MKTNFLVLASGLVALASVANAQAQVQGDPYLWALENVDANRIERRGSGSGGFARGLLLTSGTRYRLHYLRRADLAVGTVGFRAASQPGSTTRIPPVPMQRQPRADRDRDGLSDLAEAIAGTRADLPDTDGDGLDDRTEVLNGSDPLGGLGTSIGVSGRVSVALSDRHDMALVDDMALVVSQDSKQLQVFNTFLRLPPREIGRVALPDLEPQGVALAANRRVVVAGGPGGVAVVDLAGLPQPSVLREIKFPGWRTLAVATAGSLAFVSNGRSLEGELVVLDVETGAVVGRVTLPGRSMQALKLDGDHVYGLSARTLEVFSLEPSPNHLATTAIGPSQVFGSGLTVARSVAVLTEFSIFDELKFRVFDLSNPAAPTQSAEADPSLNAFNSRALTLDPAGNLLTHSLGPNGSAFLNVFDLRDPTQPTLTNSVALGGSFGSRSPSALGVYGGQAYSVSERDLQVVNYVPIDSAGVAPTLSLSASFSLASPQAEEGQLVRVTATANDDVQVRQVDWFLDGQKVLTQGNAPFDFRFQVPPRATQQSFRVRGRVFDTGGNSTFSPELTVSIQADSQAPLLQVTSPRDSAILSQVLVVQAAFSEPMALSSANASNFSLIEAGPDGAFGSADDVDVVGGSFSSSLEGRALNLVFGSPLPEGDYRVQLGSTLQDMTGNELGTAQAWAFFVRSDDHGDSLAEATQLNAGSSATGLSEPGDEDWFFVPLQAGGFYEIALVTSASATLELRTPDGASVIATATSPVLDDTPVEFEFVPAESGSYALRVSGDGNFLYEVRTRVIEDDHSDQPAEATVLTLGQPSAGAIQALPDVDLFAVTLSEGQDYEFVLTPTPSGRLALRDRDGTTVLDSASSSPRRLTRRVGPGEGGTYYLEVSSFSRATYTLIASVIQDDHGDLPGSATALTLDQEAPGLLEPAGDEDYFAATLQAGTSYRFLLVSQSTVSLTLFDADGTTPLATEFELIDYTSPTAKTVFLRVAGSGSFSLVWSLPQGDDHGDDPASATPISLDQPVSGRIDPNPEGDEEDDWFAVDLVAGEPYFFRINVPETDGFFEFFVAGPLGFLETGLFSVELGGDGFVYTPFESGTFFAVVRAYEAVGTNYTVQVDRLVDQHGDSPVTATPLVVNTLAEGFMQSATDLDVFSVQLVAGQTYTFGSEDPFRGLMVEVLDSGGAVLAMDLRSLDYTPTTSGTFYFRVSYPEQGFDYYQAYVALDDYPDDSPSAVPIPLGSTLAGQVFPDEDRDWLRIDLTPGTTYRIRFTTSDPNIELVVGIPDLVFPGTPDFNTSLPDLRLEIPELTFSPTRAGTHFLLIRNEDFTLSAGNYQVIVEVLP